MHPHLAYWLAALHLPNIGPRKFLRWLQHFENIQTLFHATEQDWHQAEIDKKYFPALAHPNWEQVEKDIAWKTNELHHILCYEDNDYPKSLREIIDPPLILFVKGNVQALSKTQLAIVGARHATPLGVKTAEQFAYTLSQSGLVITSGLALGIDAASHRGTLNANGITIAVAGTGLHHTYPPSHQRLASQIVQHSGAIISEFPLDTQPYVANFPRRNRIIGGLCVGVLVIEAAIKSGSLITARHALEQGREVFAIPGSIQQPLSRGCHYLIREGATLVEKTDDILQQLNHFIPQRPVIVDQKNDKFAHPLLNFINHEITPIDVILLRSGLTTKEVSSILLTLELDGHIQSTSGGYFRIDPIQ